MCAYDLVNCKLYRFALASVPNVNYCFWSIRSLKGYIPLSCCLPECCDLPAVACRACNRVRFSGWKGTSATCRKQQALLLFFLFSFFMVLFDSRQRCAGECPMSKNSHHFYLCSSQVRLANTQTNKSSTIYGTESCVVSLASK